MPGSVASDRYRGVGEVRNPGKGLICSARRLVDGLTATEIRLPGRSLRCSVLAAGPSEITETNNLEGR